MPAPPSNDPLPEEAVRDCVLIVDHARVACAQLADAVQEAGLASRSVQSCSTLEAELAVSSPSLILLSSWMPDGDSLTVLESLQSRFKTLPPVILTLTRGANGKNSRAFSVGAADYIYRPFDPVEVAARVTSALQRSRVRPTDPARELYSQSPEQPAMVLDSEIESVKDSADARSPVGIAPEEIDALVEEAVTAWKRTFRHRATAEFREPIQHVLDLVGMLKSARSTAELTSALAVLRSLLGAAQRLLADADATPGNPRGERKISRHDQGDRAAPPAHFTSLPQQAVARAGSLMGDQTTWCCVKAKSSGSSH
ncbi:response regulator [Lignipirellula cremea]|uniref:Transcriptional regulatory protein OmpR n=1 Tax=Lignipirellula cremea TaxID=2528010 RepID=A0A518DUD2_9BACT|nr:response regulator [Lignipirellula cremea]QDU95436.1 Transcriptional regulatory protein OmpR [Lignipirellula cremea]